jgi:hypothetical protein
MDELHLFALDQRVERVEVVRLDRAGLPDASRSECTKFAAGEPPAPVTRIRLI